MKLYEVIKYRKPIKVYLNNIFYDIFYFNKEKNIYQGDFGYIPIEKIPDILAGKEYVNHIKLESYE